MRRAHIFIVGNLSTSKKVHQALIKNGCLNEDTGLVDTARITSDFTPQLSMISIHAQRKLVSLLFYWEDELTRWHLMEDEEVQIRLQMAGQGENIAARENLEMVSRVLQANRVLLPSRRAENGAPLGDLPTYSQSIGQQ
jgi:hypothetical protein